MITRRPLLALGALGALAAGVPLSMARAADAPLVEVWKTPTCGCCRAWVRHLEEAGFRVQVTQMDDVTPVKERLKVPMALSSCHTALVGGYVVEGHVPADDIVKLLRERPKARGLVVPGMPVGSPGMEGPGGKPYDTLLLGEDGGTRVFATHTP